MKKFTAIGVCSVLSLAMFTSASLAAQNTGKLGLFIGDNQFSSNVYELAAKAGSTGAPTNQPWSGTFWPLRSGSTGNPYADRMQGSLAFKLNQLFGPRANLRMAQRRMARISAQVSSNQLDADVIKDMAPSEKYDLYLGDAEFSYTHSEWESVTEQLKYIGHIALWEGSCHGWSTAAINEPRPRNEINVMSLDGKYLIPFYPDDLKALATRLWANSLVQDHTVAEGFRCTAKNPKKDPNTGKVLDTTCEGVNAGDFHVSVLEMIGGRKTSFVVNRSNTRQVWNQPVAGYELSYFNPTTDAAGDLAASIVARTAYADPYAPFRASGATSIVGVAMKLHYVSETSPSHAVTNANSDDKIKTLELRYDLELDADSKIIGGEWRHTSDPTVTTDNSGDLQYNDEDSTTPKYPGFLWKFDMPHPTAYSIADSDIPGDDPTKVDPAILIAASKKASQFKYNVYTYDAAGNATLKRQALRPQPLGKVVNTLFQLAK